MFSPSFVCLFVCLSPGYLKQYYRPMFMYCTFVEGLDKDQPIKPRFTKDQTMVEFGSKVDEIFL